MSFILLLSLCTLFKVSIGAVSICYECQKKPVTPSGMCCFDDIECGDPLCDPSVPEPTTTEDPNATTQDPNDATTEDPNATTEDPNNTTQDPNDDPPRDPGICKYWSSASTYNQGSSTIIGGTPLDVCIGAFSGTELTSTSSIYKCSDDNTTVEYWWFTGSSDCNALGTATEATLMQWTFKPLTDPFECRGDPCPHFILMDATSHPTQTCPYDTGKHYLDGEDDYATWHEKAILQGCQSFDGSTSFALKCSDTGGISKLNYDNTECNSNGLIGAEEMLQTATVECNYGTGRSVSCANGITSRNRHFAYHDPDPYGNNDITTTINGNTGSTVTVAVGPTPVNSHGNVYGIYQAIFYILGIFVYILW